MEFAYLTENELLTEFIPLSESASLLKFALFVDPAPAVTCPPGFFTCANGKCVEFEMVCNGVPECSDGSDESNCSMYLSYVYEYVFLHA